MVEDGVAVCIIDAVSDELKSHLREQLATYCYGAATASEDSDYYSFEKTIIELLDRYETKATSVKVGMSGEFILHVLMSEAHPHLASTAVFFNKEERNIKKGFDLTFHEKETESIWYGEVKSGEVSPSSSASTKSGALLKEAALDLANKLGEGATRSRWDSAIADAALTLESDQAATVKMLLRSDVSALGESPGFDKKAVLGAAIMHSPHHCEIDSTEVIAAVEHIKNANHFSSLCILVVQQEECETVISYLKETVSADG